MPFVVGVARSGTTLLRLMLDAHPSLAIPPETHFLPLAVRAAAGAASPDGAFCDAVVAGQRWGDFGLDEAALRARVAAVRPFDAGDALRAFYKLYAEQFGKPRWGDKTPPYLAFMTPIEAILPEACFVHVVRDGRDVACSVVPLEWGPASVAEAAATWKAGIEGARADAPGLARYLEVRYEDLVTCTEAVLRRICEAIELPFHPAMLESHLRADERMAEMEGPLLDAEGGVISGRADRRALHRLTRSPPRVERIGRWRAELGRAERETYGAIAGGLLAELGYGE